MSLPWHKASTAAILGLRQNWTTDAPIPEALALVELGALAVSGQLASKTMRRLAGEWGWSRGRLTRRLAEWGRAGFLDFADGPQTDLSLPSWWATKTKEDHKDTASDGPQTDHKRTTNAPRARSTLKEVEGEREGDTPHTPPGVEVEPLPFPVFKVDPAEVSADERRAWSSYRRHLGDGDRLTRKRLGSLRARLKEHGVDQIVALGDWLATSQHERAVYLRQRADPKTALRPDNCLTYLEMMVKGSRAPSGKASKADMSTGACDLLDRLFGEGEAVKASQPAIEVFSHPVAP